VPRERALRLLGTGRALDVVFADPPYGEGAVDAALRLVRSLGLLAPGGVFVVQHSVRDGVPARREGYRVEDSRRYGDTALSFLILPEAPEGDQAQPEERDRPDG
jgi:16S rRNA G966 N2-methylase RsmD